MSDQRDLAAEWAKTVLAIASISEQRALDYLRDMHNRQCNCGMDGGPDGAHAGPKILLTQLRQKWGSA